MRVCVMCEMCVVLFRYAARAFVLYSFMRRVLSVCPERGFESRLRVARVDIILFVQAPF